jgi:hypothetical protein
MTATALSDRRPSGKRAVGSVNANGASKSVIRSAPSRVTVSRRIPGSVPVTVAVRVTATSPTTAELGGLAMQRLIE